MLFVRLCWLAWSRKVKECTTRTSQAVILGAAHPSNNNRRPPLIIQRTLPLFASRSQSFQQSSYLITRSPHAFPRNNQPYASLNLPMLSNLCLSCVYLLYCTYRLLFATTACHDDDKNSWQSSVKPDFATPTPQSWSWLNLPSSLSRCSVRAPIYSGKPPQKGLGFALCCPLKHPVSSSALLCPAFTAFATRCYSLNDS